MSKYLVLILFIVNVKLPFAQPKNSGKITFKETIKFKMDFGGDNPELAKMLPPSQSIDKVLFFDADQSLFKNNDKPKDLKINHEEEGNQMQMVFKMPESVVYINTKDQVLLQSEDLMGKEFLISDKPTTQTWKVTGEQKKILNYVCQKAILNDTSAVTIAWFTPQIPVSAGPSAMNGLPGMILAIERDNGDRMTIATSIEDLPSGFVFEKPSKGKKVGKKEFEKIRDEKMKEMGAINGKGPGVKMIIREEKH